MLIIHDSRLPDEYIDTLKRSFPCGTWHPFDTPAESEVYSSILSHPDIYFFQADNNTLIHAPGVPESLIQELSKNGVDLILGEISPRGTYPRTAGYNAVRVGDIVFHNLCCTDPVILEKAREAGLRAVHVAQGYTRCSVLIVNDRAIVTPDRGIARAAEKEGLDVLIVEPGHVFLPGEGYGFLGGSGGKIPGGPVMLLGDLSCHPEASRIKNFLNRQGTGLIEVKGKRLYDAGSLMILQS